MSPELSPTPPSSPTLDSVASSVPPALPAESFDAKAEQERQARAVYASMEQMHASISRLK